MIVRKTLRIPVHHAITQSKLDRLDRLTARITFGIALISSLISDDIELDRKTVRKLAKDNDIASRTGLSTGFVDQCVDKVIWSWKSYRKLHADWERRVASAEEHVEFSRDDKEKIRSQKYLAKLLKREPSHPAFEERTPCRIDCRTGRIERGRNTFLLWMHISTLQKNKPMDIPLNPSHYHLVQLECTEIDDFEIVKHNKKYYAHISISKEIIEKKASSVEGIDQGLNRTIATVLLDDMPQEELLCDSDKRNLIDKYDSIIASVQQTWNSRKLKQLRHKRSNVAIYHDWCLANHVAEATEGYLIAIGNSRFQQTQYRGNSMPALRKRIGKWSYSRQRQNIALKRSERGYPTKLLDERYTSKTCHACGSKLVKRKWLDGSSYILCHCCGLKDDADLNAAYNIALRCRDDWLKVQMNPVENWASA